MSEQPFTAEEIRELRTLLDVTKIKKVKDLYSMLMDGRDYDALTEKMAAIKKQYPAVSQFFLAADKEIKYDVIVHTMDATRGDKDHPLFPDVAFAAVM